MKTSLRNVITFLTVLLAGILVFMPFAFALEPEELPHGEEGGLEWSLDENGCLTICGSGAMPDWDDLTESAPGWFAYRDEIVEIVVSQGVTSIGANAFYQEELLACCSLPEGLAAIGDRAFALCEGLEEAVIPSTVTSIGRRAFYGCTALGSVRFLGGPPSIASDCFYGVSGAYMYPNCLYSAWDDSAMLQYGGTRLHWELHAGIEETVQKLPGCTEDGITVRTCGNCGWSENLIIPASGHKTTYIAAVEETCTADGSKAHYHCSACGKDYSDASCSSELAPEDIITYRKGHITVIDEQVPATADTPGLTRGEHCGRCGAVLVEQKEIPALGYDIHFEGLPDMTRVDIGGESHYTDMDGNINVSCPPSGFAAAYTFNIRTEVNLYQRYPTGMTVYALYVGEGGVCTAERLPFLDDTAGYAGCSIKNRGTTGIRGVYSIPESTLNTLTWKGTDGFRLLEYGMLGASGNIQDLNLSYSGVGVDSLYVSGESDRHLFTAGSRVFYAGEFLELVVEQWGEDYTIRPYMLFETPWGQDVLYGPPVVRSLGYIAELNEDTYEKGTAEYRYIRNIINNS